MIGLHRANLGDTYAATFSMKSTCTAVYGNSIRPSSSLRNTPACSSMCTSECTARTSRPTRRAASRNVTGPAPVSVCTSAMRLGASTFQSKSNDWNEIRSCCRLPAKVCFTRCLKDSVESTVIVTAPISFPLSCGNVSQEVVEQLVDGDEHVGHLLGAYVLVIALASLVVVAKHALAGDHVGEPVLEAVRRPAQRLRQPPDDHFDEASLQHAAFAHQEFSFYVAHASNIAALLSTSATGIPRSTGNMFPDLPYSRAKPKIGVMAQRVERHLCVIFSADVAGYSRLMRLDEEGTLAQLVAARGTMDSLVVAHRGRVVNSVGDSVLAEFSSVIDGIEAAIEIQRDIAAAASGIPAEQRVLFRIGLQLGEVMVKSTDIYGDGVNVAARLQSLAEAGGIVVSGTVHEQLRDRLSIPFVSLGEQSVKNIDRPVPAFGLAADAIAHLPRSIPPAPPAHKTSHRRYGIAAVAMLAVIGSGWWLAQSETLASWRARLGGGDAVAPDTGRLVAMSLVIAPLSATSGDAGAAQFADVLRRDLGAGITATGGDVQILTLGSDSQSGAAGHVRESARRIGARYVLEVEVRRESKDTVAGLKLLDIENATQVWAGQLTLKESDDAMESKIAQRKLIGRIQREIKAAETRRVVKLPISRLTPTELVLRGGAVNQRGTLEAAIEARSMFDKALAADPYHVMALKYRGRILNEFLDLDPNVNLDRIASEGEDFAVRAMRLAPESPESLELRSVSLRYLRRWNAAIEANGQAIMRDPFFPFYYTHNAYLLILTGRPEDALEWIDRALALKPADASTELTVQCYALLLLGREDSAIQSCEKSNAVDDYWGNQVFLVAAYANKGDTERTANALRALQKGAPGYTIARAKQYSDVPEYLKLAETYWLSGLRKAGIPEK